MFHRIQKRPPDLPCLLGTQARRNHSDLESVVGPYMDLLTPMLVEEMIAIEGDDVADEAAVPIIGGRFDRDVCRAEKLGQLVRAHRHPAHDTEGATSSAFQSPEQIGIGARI